MIQTVEESTCNAGDLGWEDSGGKHGGILTPVFLLGESPRTEEPDGLQSTGSQRFGHDRATKQNTAQHRGSTSLSYTVFHLVSYSFHEVSKEGLIYSISRRRQVFILIF